MTIASDVTTYNNVLDGNLFAGAEYANSLGQIYKPLSIYNNFAFFAKSGQYDIVTTASFENPLV